MLDHISKFVMATGREASHCWRDQFHFYQNDCYELIFNRLHRQFTLLPISSTLILVIVIASFFILEKQKLCN